MRRGGRATSPSRFATRRVAAVVLTATVWGAAADAAEVATRPGSVVRWAGDGFETCGRDSRTWPATRHVCWYSIDLLAPMGVFEVFSVREDGMRAQAQIRVTAYPYPEQRITLEDSSKVDLSAEDVARVRREQARVKSLWALDSPARFELPLGPPLQNLGPAGSFGSRRYFNDQPRSPHSGADFSAPEGQPVQAVAPGTVVLAADLFFSGQSVFVDHGDGLISMYFHLSTMAVEEGDEVEERAVIGRVGQTGRTTGPHLHFGLRWRGARVDPSLLLGSPELIPSLGAADSDPPGDRGK